MITTPYWIIVITFFQTRYYPEICAVNSWDAAKIHRIPYLCFYSSLKVNLQMSFQSGTANRMID